MLLPSNFTMFLVHFVLLPLHFALNLLPDEQDATVQQETEKKLENIKQLTVKTKKQ